MGSCWLDHGDLLILDGECQDELVHRASPRFVGDRMNVTFRWVKRHGSVRSCVGAVVCGPPTCAHGSSFLPPVAGVSWGAFPVLAGFLLALILGILCWFAGLKVPGSRLEKAGGVVAQDTFFER